MKNHLEQRIIKTALVLVSAFVLVVQALSMDSYAATAAANATAAVIAPIAISNTEALAFGTFGSGAGGTVVMSSAGARSSTGAVILSSSDAGAAASFTVTGAAGAAYTITLPANATITSGADSMMVDTFISSPDETGMLDSAGEQTISVGATLTVLNGQAPENYMGNFNVYVEYN